jgi:hypothetical protein
MLFEFLFLSSSLESVFIDWQDMTVNREREIIVQPKKRNLVTKITSPIQMMSMHRSTKRWNTSTGKKECYFLSHHGLISEHDWDGFQLISDGKRTR